MNHWIQWFPLFFPAPASKSSGECVPWKSVTNENIWSEWCSWKILVIKELMITCSRTYIFVWWPLMIQESWLMLKKQFLQAQDWFVSVSWKWNKHGMRPKWFLTNSDIKTKCTRGGGRTGDAGRVWRHWLCMNGYRKTKAHLVLNLARDVKDKDGFYKYVNRRMTWQVLEEEERKCGPTAEWGRNHGEKGHRKGQGAHCFLHLSLYC